MEKTVDHEVNGYNYCGWYAYIGPQRIRKGIGRVEWRRKNQGYSD